MFRWLTLFAAVSLLAVSSREAQAADAKSPPLRHVVLFKFKPEVTKAQVAEVVEAFAALPKKIEAITAFEWGTDVSVEMKAAGFTHAFVVTFADAKGRDVYLPHPAHAEFVKLVGPRLENVLVFDFVAGK
ncbi:MAG: Dabb family protein [Pirellulaceae bacterium]|nr:Dabb family protein [Pirellulaceae bacterium]